MPNCDLMENSSKCIYLIFYIKQITKTCMNRKEKGERYKVGVCSYSKQLFKIVLLLVIILFLLNNIYI